MNEKMIFLCKCGWKSISSIENVGIVEIKNNTLSNRKFRCPSCGFAITPRKTKDPQAEAEKSIKEKEMAEETKKWLEQSIERQIDFIKEMSDGEEDSDQ